MTAKKGTSCAYAVILTTYSKNMSDGKTNGKTSAMSKVNWSSSLTVSDLQSLWDFSLQRVSSCYLPGWITSFPEMKKLRSDDTSCCVSAVISPLPKSTGRDKPTVSLHAARSSWPRVPVISLHSQQLMNCNKKSGVCRLQQAQKTLFRHDVPTKMS